MAILRVSSTVAGSGAAAPAYGNRSAEAKPARSPAFDTAFFSERANEAIDAANKAEAAKKDTSEEKSDQKSFSELIKEQTEKINELFSTKEHGRADDRQLMSIRLKMRGGLMLTANEEKYLSEYDPDSYSNYRTTQDARKMFRSQLMCCRTKDEVNGMRLSNALSALSAYKKAVKRGGDGSAVAGLNMALEREISSFSQSGRYRSLPTSAERDKYYMELAKARRFEREKRQTEKLNALRKKKKQIKSPGDGKRTVAQVRNSYLGRKVRNAGKGGVCGVCFTSFTSGSYNKMDQKG